MAGNDTPMEKPVLSEGFPTDRDHIVVGIGNDGFGPYWSTLGQNLAPVTLESALRSRQWYRDNHPGWDVRIYRIEEVDGPAAEYRKSEP
jgi:hypothetical protein